MLVLEEKCPKCYGNLVLGEEDMSLTCEDCAYHENTKDKQTFAIAIEEAEEWGPKTERYTPSLAGELLLKPYEGLAGYLRETLEEGMKGLDLEESELNQLRKWGLINEGKKTEKVEDPGE